MQLFRLSLPTARCLKIANATNNAWITARMKARVEFPHNYAILRVQPCVIPHVELSVSTRQFSLLSPSIYFLLGDIDFGQDASWMTWLEKSYQQQDESTSSLRDELKINKYSKALWENKAEFILNEYKLREFNFRLKGRTGTMDFPCLMIQISC